MTLTVQPDGDVHVRLESGLEALVNGARWDNDNLTGRFAGTIPTSDASRWPHYVELSLRLRQGTLSGMASAVTTSERVYFALSSYVSLTRKAAAAKPN